MMDPINKGLAILTSALAFMLMGSGVFIYKYRADVAEQKAKVTKVKAKLQTEKVNNATCKNALAERNEKLIANSIEYKKRVAAVKVMTAAEVEQKLKIEYRDRNVSKEICNETASVIDAIRRTGF